MSNRKYRFGNLTTKHQSRVLRPEALVFFSVLILSLLAALVPAFSGQIASAPTFSISGTVTNSSGAPIANATIEVTGDVNIFTSTDSAGNYVINGLNGGDAYTVTPSSSGLAFAPPNRTFTNLSANVANANFVGTQGQAFSIAGQVTDSGGAPIANVAIAVIGAMNIFTSTDSAGNYAINGLTGGGNYTVTPSLAGLAFNPPNRVFNNLSANVANANFVGTQAQAFSIAGRVTDSGGAAIANVTIAVTGDTTIFNSTDSAGNYAINGLTGGGNYTLTPSLAGVTFNPPSRAFNNLSASVSNANFVGTQAQTFSISGTVTNSSGGPIADVVIAVTGDASILNSTDSAGNFVISGLTGGGNYTLTPSKAGFAFAPHSRSFTNLNANVTNANFTERIPPVLQFSSNSLTFDESNNFGTMTVTRTGDTSGPATVKYATSDATDVNFNCNPATQGQIVGAASRKCDYHIAAGRVRFAAGESSKQIILSLVNDVYVEGTEALTIRLSSPTGAALGAFDLATINITDNDLAGGQPNPIDATPFYVRMLYVDLLSREPDPVGFAAWVHRIDFCGQPGEPPPPCDRVTVGGDGFMRSAEFFERQFFVIKLYRAGLGRILRYDDVGDLAYVSGFLTDADLELNKQELVTDIMSRTEFSSLYNGLPSASYVDLLIQTAAVTIPQNVRDAWVTALGNSSKTRAQVYRELSERPEVSSKFLHEAQVVSCYYGFFTRNPDGAYFTYLDRLDRGEITLADLANAFINAGEYRQRFGP